MRQPGCHLSSLGCKLNRHEGTLVPSPLQYIRTSDPPERQLITGHCNACDTEPHAQAKRLAARIGAPATIAAGGIVCLAGALVFARHLPHLRTEARQMIVELQMTGGGPPEEPT